MGYTGNSKSFVLFKDGNSSKQYVQVEMLIPMNETAWLSNTLHHNHHIKTTQNTGSWI